MMIALTPGTILLFGLFGLLVFFSLQAMFMPSMAGPKSVDIVVFGALLIIGLIFMQTNLSWEEIQQRGLVKPYVKWSLQTLDSFQALLFIAASAAVLFVVSKLFDFQSASPWSLLILQDLTWVFLILCLANEFMKMAFRISLFAELEKWIVGEEKPVEEATSPSAPVTPTVPHRGEVFHIGNQLYTYAEADELCRLVNDSRLATKQELEMAYASGADWNGSYGWCEGQGAYTISPEQGVVGGKAKKADYLLGVNCVGKKPSMSDRDRTLMEMIRAESKGLTTASQLKLMFAELNPNAFMTIRPFNMNQWNEEGLKKSPEDASASSSTSLETKINLLTKEDK